VGQDAILRGDCQSPRVPIGNRHAAWQAAPQSHRLRRVRQEVWRQARRPILL
jgi:hypothetical protein